MRKQTFKNSFIKKNNLVLWNGKFNRSDIIKLANYYEKAFRTSWSQAQKMAWNKARAEKKQKQSVEAPKQEKNSNVVSLNALRSELNIEAVSMSIEYGIHPNHSAKIIRKQWSTK